METYVNIVSPYIGGYAPFLFLIWSPLQEKSITAHFNISEGNFLLFPFRHHSRNMIYLIILLPSNGIRPNSCYFCRHRDAVPPFQKSICQKLNDVYAPRTLTLKTIHVLSENFSKKTCMESLFCARYFWILNVFDVR